MTPAPRDVEQGSVRAEPRQWAVNGSCRFEAQRQHSTRTTTLIIIPAHRSRQNQQVDALRLRWARVMIGDAVRSLCLLPKSRNYGIAIEKRMGVSNTVRTDFSGGVADHQVAPAEPDDLVAAVVQGAAADLGDVDISVALD